MPPYYFMAKVASYVILGVFANVAGMWSPAEALVVCSTGFAVDGLVTTLLIAAGWTSSTTTRRVMGFVVPLVSLLVARGFAEFLGLG